MKHMISYTLHPDRVAENERLVGAVYEALHASEPDGLRYGTFKLGDGVSFVHIVSYEGEESGKPLTTLPAFQAFVAGINDRCSVSPVRVAMTEVGSYGFFAA